MAAAPLPFIDLKRLYALHKEEFDAALLHVAGAAQYIMGPEVKQCEQILAEYVGVKHAIACSSGTSSLELAVRALDIGPGDEVITVPFTWVATANSIAMTGATPVLVDIDPHTYTMDVEACRKAITPKTRAIMPVSLFGHMPDLAALKKIADEAPSGNCVVIEDAAQSFGAMQDGKRSCGASAFGCTSFYPSKPLGGWGEGGAVFTDNDAHATKMRAILNHGGTSRDDHYVIGTNARLDTLQAAVLNVRMKYFPEEVIRRQEVAKRYSEALSQIKGVESVPVIKEGNLHAWAQYTITVADSATRAKVREAMSAEGVPTCVFYEKCVHLENAYKYLNQGPGSFPVAEACAARVLQLPFHPWMHDDEVDRVIEAVRKALAA